MKAGTIVVLVCVLLGWSTGVSAQPADPPPPRDLAAELALSRLLVAVVNDDPRALVRVMDRAVVYEVDASACGKPYRRPGVARGGSRLRLARCLVKLDWPTHAAPLQVVEEDDHVRIVLSRDQDQWIAVFADRGGATTLIAVRYGSANRPLRATASDAHFDLLANDVDQQWAAGVPEGAVAGLLTGVPGAAPPPPPPPPPSISMVPPPILNENRLAGEVAIAPDDATRAAITADGKTKIVTAIKVCVDRDGKIADVRVLKSTGYPAYDARLGLIIRTTWRFRPVVINGKAEPVCSMYTIVYQQR